MFDKSEPLEEPEKTAEAAQHSRVETWQLSNHSFVDSGCANATVRAVHREEWPREPRARGSGREDSRGSAA